MEDTLKIIAIISIFAFFVGSIAYAIKNQNDLTDLQIVETKLSIELLKKQLNDK